MIITGASTGIGEQLAYHYARLGANVVIAARRKQRLKEVVILNIQGKSTFHFIGGLPVMGQRARKL